LIPTLDIAENVYLGRELVRQGSAGRRLRWMDKARMRRQVEEGFARLGLSLPSVRTKVGALSGGQRQAVAIARAVLWGSHIVLLDEPTAALGVRQTEIVLSFVERLKVHGVAVVLVSHNMQHVMRVADRIVVLRLGEKTFDGAKAEVTGTQLVGLMTGALTGTEVNARQVS
jgi:ABC-type sugar transport system ATPase subunit